MKKKIFDQTPERADVNVYNEKILWSSWYGGGKMSNDVIAIRMTVIVGRTAGESSRRGLKGPH